MEDGAWGGCGPSTRMRSRNRDGSQGIEVGTGTMRWKGSRARQVPLYAIFRSEREKWMQRMVLGGCP